MTIQQQKKISGKLTKIKCHNNNSRVYQVLGRSASQLAVFCRSRQSSSGVNPPIQVANLAYSGTIHDKSHNLSHRIT